MSNTNTVGLQITSSALTEEKALAKLHAILGLYKACGGTVNAMAPCIEEVYDNTFSVDLIFSTALKNTSAVEELIESASDYVGLDIMLGNEDWYSRVGTANFETFWMSLLSAYMRDSSYPEDRSLGAVGVIEAAAVIAEESPAELHGIH